ncbi:MAG: dTDP-4-dehydrorhamnose reductase [Chlamydiia bacterium]|nr:dTDP-4-dehydrorhamnose reductase [Chlamydiia bacterium]MCH9616429.1 dTDP-4-dehydrorhamnose reductase [Chlamydiia bacterium]MCH9629585.1 dTDP-4-dehydrorhamnose reductase [Chlamydiia bacterium]
MKTLIIGAKGFLGRYFHKRFKEMIGTHYQKEEPFELLDLKDPKIEFPLDGYRYALFAGGMSNPGRCEVDPEESYAVNVEGTLKLSKWLLKNGIQPILISTGYVFDGVKGGYLETDPTAPPNIYGLHKAILEKKAPSECLILRAAKLYGLEKGDGTLLDEMAAKLSMGETVLAAKDQVLSPLSIDDFIQAIVELQKVGASGIYHVGGKKTSRYHLACKLAEEMRVDQSFVQPVSLDAIPGNFKRAKKTDFCSEKLKAATGFVPTQTEAHCKLFAAKYFSAELVTADE